MFGLRGRVAAVVAVSCALVAIVVGAIGYGSVQRRLVDEVDRSLDQVSLLLVAGRVQERVPARVLGDVYTARQFDSAGRVVRTNFTAPLDERGAAVDEVLDLPGRRSYSSAVDDDGVRLRLLTIGLERGAIQIARPLTETDNVLDDLRGRTLLLVLLTSVAGAAVGWLIAGRVAAPIRRLATAAETVERSGQLDVDLGPEGGRDEVGRLRRSFGSMLGALGRSRQEQQRLVQDAGHELRTPLTALRTNLAVLGRHQDMPDEMRAEVLADLTSEVDELADLVDELVAAAQGELGDEVPIEVDAAAMAATVADRVGRRRGRELRVVAGDGPAMVNAGPLGLARAMTNVVDNACKFAEDGSIEVSVQQRSTPNGPVVAFRVADEGPGVPDEELGRIFDRFHRVEATRTMPGSGLGLAIVRESIDRAGGSVVAVNRPAGGAEIGFDLPSL